MSLRWDPLVLSRMSISTRLLLWFLVVSLVPCGIVMVWISHDATQSLKKSVRHGLLAIADAKIAQLARHVGL